MNKFLYLFLLFLALPLSAAVNFQNYSTNPQSGISVEYTYLFDSVNDEVFGARVPLLVRISNLTKEAQSWQLQTKSDWDEHADVYKTRLEVEGQSTRLFNLDVPIGDFMDSTTLPRVEISGYGVNANHWSSVSLSITKLEGRVASRQAYKALKTSTGNDDYGYAILEKNELDFLPTSWSSYSSLSTILLTGQDYNALRDDQRMAIREWVLAGGLLQMMDVKSEETKKSILGFLKLKEAGSTGFGNLVFLKAESYPHFPSSALALQTDFHAEAINTMSETVEEPGVSLILVGFLLGVFLIIVGPVNLYVLNKKNRLGLLVTTPIISLAASLLYALIIILYDGFGGEGVQSSFVWLEPEHKRCVVSQSQAMQMGIMLSSNIKRESQYLVNAYKADRYDDFESVNILMDGNWLGGDIFNSRSRRFLELKDMRTTQASLELVEGDKPSVRSNFQGQLKNILVHDSEGQDWFIENCGPGETVELRKANLNDANTESHRKLFNRMKSFKKNYFMAQMQEGNQFEIPTHDSVDFESLDILLGGSLTQGDVVQ